MLITLAFSIKLAISLEDQVYHHVMSTKTIVTWTCMKGKSLLLLLLLLLTSAHTGLFRAKKLPNKHKKHSSLPQEKQKTRGHDVNCNHFFHRQIYGEC